MSALRLTLRRRPFVRAARSQQVIEFTIAPNPLAYGYIAATFIVGALLYVIAKKRRQNEGSDISLTFKEIPPE